MSQTSRMRLFPGNSHHVFHDLFELFERNGEDGARAMSAAVVATADPSRFPHVVLDDDAKATIGFFDGQLEVGYDGKPTFRLIKAVPPDMEREARKCASLLDAEAFVLPGQGVPIMPSRTLVSPDNRY